MPYRNIVASAYDAGVDEEYNRLIETPSGRQEYQLICGLLNEYLPYGSTVIDIGSGPGRYAEYLLNQNCKVGVVDLSAKSLKAFSDRLSDTSWKDNIIFNRVSCATQLDWIADSSADAILLLGPLYHLVEKDHRNIALSHCKRILKPGGHLFSIFLSSDPDNHLQSESITLTVFQGFEVPQFRCKPADAERVMTSNGFETIRLMYISDERSFKKNVNHNPKSFKRNLLNDAVHTIAKNPNHLSIRDQFLYVGSLCTSEKK